MAQTKVSDLTEKTSPSGSEELLINDAGTSKKITIANAFTDTDTTYSAGSSSALGLIKLEDDITQTEAANTVSATASRTYGLQINGSGQGVVNVPWTDTDTTNDVVDDTSPQLGGDLDCNGSQIQWSQGADVASDTALAVLTDGNYFDVTGTTAITSINTTGGIGTLIKLHFDGALTLTHDATDLILPGGANITTAAGDEAEFIEYAAGDYRCTNYSKASGAAVVPGSYTLPEANATTKGGIELFSDTDQSVAAESVSTTANRTYGLQLNSDGQGVVNVPWSDTDTDTTYTASDFKLDDLATPDDNTDLDFSTTRHGLVPKGTNTGDFLKDDGTWASAGGTITALNSATENELVTIGSTTTELDAEANLTFDGNQLVVTGSTSPSFSAIKTDDGTTGHLESASFTRTTSGDMADTYGGAIQLKLGDSGSAATGVCAIDWERNGADNSGKLFLYTRNAGTWNAGLTIDASASDVTVERGDIVFGTAGKGVCLGVTTNTDSNTLDDYEEGEVTNGLDINGTTQTSYSSGRGNIQYTKVGRIVHLQCYLDTEGATLATTGTLHMRLPFAVSEGSGTALVTGQNLFVFTIAGVGDFPVLTYFNEGDTTIHGYRMALPSITGTDYVQTGDIFANTTTSQRIIMKIAMSYQTD